MESRLIDLVILPRFDALPETARKPKTLRERFDQVLDRSEAGIHRPARRRARYVHRTAHDREPSHVPIAMRSAIQPQVIVDVLNPKFARHTSRQNPVRK